MKAEQSGTLKQPIVINDRLIDRIKTMVADMIAETIDVAAREENLTTDAILEFQKDRSPYDALIGDPAPIHAEEYSLYSIRRDTLLKLNSVANKIDRQTAVSVNITFVGGYSAKLDNLDQIKKTVSDEYSKLESVAIYFGLGSGGVGFSLRLTGGITTTRFTVYGNRPQLEHYTRYITDTIRMCKPQHAFLHTAKLQIIITVLAGFLTQNAIVSRGGEYQKTYGLFSSSAQIVMFGVSLIAQITVFFLLSKMLENTFPKLLCEYGYNWENHNKNRALTIGIVTVIIIPTILEIAL